MKIWDYINIITSSLILLSALYAFVVSLTEREKIAAGRFLVTGLVLAFAYALVALASFPGQRVASVFFVVVTAVVVMLLFIPFDKFMDMPVAGMPKSHNRIDERDIMFSRRELLPGTPRFNSYYKRRPENKAPDDRFRSKPGLLSPQALYADPLRFAAARASFEAVEALHPLTEGKAAGKAISGEAIEFSRFIHWWGEKLGAHSLGITPLQDYHLYSIKGRGERYGEKIENTHRYAVALTVEMDYDMMRYAPRARAVMESSRQYLRAGAIAVQIAQYIRNIGYAATAHIDARYEVVCPLVARDAGLGEIGRMGLLMTPDLGPRVRIAVVTTNLPLITDSAKQDRSMIDFCRHCKKCAQSCPANAIPFDDMKEIDGVLRWQINSKACYTFWCSIGTDCGRCVAVCPYAHADNALHAAIRYGIRHSSLFRRLGIRLDDFFYGSSPVPPGEQGCNDSIS